MRKKLFYEKYSKQLRETFESFAIKRLRQVTELGNKVCDETVRISLKKKRCKFLHSRKKGLLKPEDLKERLNFPERLNRYLRKISG